MKRNLTHKIILWFCLALPLLTFAQAGTYQTTVLWGNPGVRQFFTLLSSAH